MIYILLILSVVLGATIAFLVQLNARFTKLLLAFSGAFLLAIVVFHLLPEVFSNTQENKTIGLFIVIGMLAQMILEFFSDGVEHGHVHRHDSKIPVLLLVSLFIHSFLEGMPLNTANHSFLIGILMHKLPIAIVITSFLLQQKTKKISLFIILIAFALMAPLGSYFGNTILFLQDNHNYIAALVIGVLTHVATTILYESSENHQFNFYKFLSVIVAFTLAYFI